MATPRDPVLILATGGTIAGAAAHGADNVRYASARVGVEQLVAAVPALADRPLIAEQLAQVDSKDMSPAIWRALAVRVRQAIAEARVAGVVVTHGTDTLEETAYWLHRTVRAERAVVLTAAMRPSTSLQADGPQNLLDAVTVAGARGARGVVAVLGGRVLAACELRKVHNYRIDAFSSGDAGPVALVEEGCPAGLAAVARSGRRAAARAAAGRRQLALDRGRHEPRRRERARRRLARRGRRGRHRRGRHRQWQRAPRAGRRAASGTLGRGRRAALDTLPARSTRARSGTTCPAPAA